MKSEEIVNFITTDIGKIALYQKQNQSTKTPIIFLHGVYFDYHLWDEIIDKINDRTVISIDMLALKGVADYVPAPPSIETIVIGGGHISPLEQPEEVLNLVNKLLNS